MRAVHFQPADTIINDFKWLRIYTMIDDLKDKFFLTYMGTEPRFSMEDKPRFTDPIYDLRLSSILLRLWLSPVHTTSYPHLALDTLVSSKKWKYSGQLKSCYYCPLSALHFYTDIFVTTCFCRNTGGVDCYTLFTMSPLTGHLEDVMGLIMLVLSKTHTLSRLYIRYDPVS